jgi:hypothetical protein
MCVIRSVQCSSLPRATNFPSKYRIPTCACAGTTRHEPTQARESYHITLDNHILIYMINGFPSLLRLSLISAYRHSCLNTRVRAQIQTALASDVKNRNKRHPDRRARGCKLHERQ